MTTKGNNRFKMKKPAPTVSSKGSLSKINTTVTPKLKTGGCNCGKKKG